MYHTWRCVRWPNTHDTSPDSAVSWTLPLGSDVWEIIIFMIGPQILNTTIGIRWRCVRCPNTLLFSWYVPSFYGIPNTTFWVVCVKDYYSHDTSTVSAASWTRRAWGSWRRWSGSWSTCTWEPWRTPAATLTRTRRASPSSRTSCCPRCAPSAVRSKVRASHVTSGSVPSTEQKTRKTRPDKNLASRSLSLDYERDGRFSSRHVFRIFLLVCIANYLLF